MRVDWTTLKGFADTRNIARYIQYVDYENSYFIKVRDEYFELETIIDKVSPVPDPSDQKDFEDNYKASANNRFISTEYGAQNVHVLKPTEPSTKQVSHWWNDKTTWYQKSTRVTGETLTTSDNLTYSAVNTNFINLENGLMYQEDDYSAPHLVKVYADAVLQTTGFTINYAAGTVTFSSSQSGKTITADYSHPTGAGQSTWTLAPEAGKMINIEHTEVQFSGDVKIPNKFFGDASTTWFDFQIWVYNPLDLPNKIPYRTIRYKSEMDIISDANLAYPHPKFGNLPGSSDYLVFPFNYGSLQPLKASQGAELRVSLKDDIPIEGSFASLTVYFLSRDE
jgi:hypothetical protein